MLHLIMQRVDHYERALYSSRANVHSLEMRLDRLDQKLHHSLQAYSAALLGMNNRIDKLADMLSRTMQEMRSMHHQSMTLFEETGQFQGISNVRGLIQSTSQRLRGHHNHFGTRFDTMVEELDELEQHCRQLEQHCRPFLVPSVAAPRT
jgi:chromosome segregation ATPase